MVRTLWPDPGLPAPPYAASAGATDPRTLVAAAAGYWGRRGLHTDPGQVVAAPSAEPLLAALLAAAGGDAVVVGRPAAVWHSPPGLRTLRVRTPAEGGGAPDPFALLETVRRARADGLDPRVLVLAAADDPTGTVTPPEPLHEVCEAAAGAGLLLISDETYNDTLHHHGVVLLSPAEILPGRTVVLTDLRSHRVPAAIARFPADGPAAALRQAVRTETLPPYAARAAAYTLAEPADVRAYAEAARRLHAAVGGAACAVLREAGALCRPPECGFQLYADLAPLSTGRDAAGAEEWLTRRLGRPVPGGHRFGDDPSAPRVRIDVGPLCGTGEEPRRAALEAADPLTLPHITDAVRGLAEVLSELSGDG